MSRYDYLADIVSNGEGGLTVDGKVVRTIEDVERITTRFKKKVLKCKERVDDLFIKLKAVVGGRKAKKKKQPADTELSATETKKQKKTKKGKKRDAADKSKKKKKVKKAE